MKIIHVCQNGNEPFNGMSVVIPQHVCEQAKYEDVMLINLRDNRFHFENEKILSLNLDDLNSIGFDNLPNGFNQPDLVVFHGIFLFEIWKFYIKYIKNKFKYIVIPHGSMNKGSLKVSKLKKELANLIIVNNFTRNAMCVQFLSENEKVMSRKKYYKKAIVLGNGVNKKDKIKKNNVSNVLKLIYIGRIDNNAKGLDLLIKACTLGKNQLLDKVQIKIYGVGSDEEKDKKMIKENQLEQIISFNGPVYKKDKEKALLESDFFIQPSRSEGQPMSILEALSYGIPVLACDGAGFSEIINEYKCGYSSPCNAEKVKEMLIKAIDNKMNIEMMSSNALKAVNDFYWENITRQTLNEYKRLINESRG